jgi:hypothetical protein
VRPRQFAQSASGCSARTRYGEFGYFHLTSTEKAVVVAFTPRSRAEHAGFSVDSEQPVLLGRRVVERLALVHNVHR